jgi:predicted ester cyclase
MSAPVRTSNEKEEEMSEQTSQQNKTLARRWFEDLFSRGDLDAANEILSADFVDHLTRGDERGLEELKYYVTVYRTAFPDIQDTVEDIVAEGDKVVVRRTSHGTHQGEFMDVAPTGRHVTFTRMRLLRARLTGAVGHRLRLGQAAQGS